MLTVPKVRLAQASYSASNLANAEILLNNRAFGNNHPNLKVLRNMSDYIYNDKRYSVKYAVKLILWVFLGLFLAFVLLHVVSFAFGLGGFKNEFITEWAVYKKDIKVCDDIPAEEGYGKGSGIFTLSRRFRCYNFVARKTGNVEICRFVNQQELQELNSYPNVTNNGFRVLRDLERTNQCYSWVAEKTKNIQLCENVEEPYRRNCTGGFD